MKIESSPTLRREFHAHQAGSLETGDVAHTHCSPDNGRIVQFGRISALLGAAFVLAFIALELYFLGMLLAAMMCGMAESRGRCGVSHIGMLAPLKSLNSRTWVKCCLSYSLSGVVTAYLIGLLIAGLGTWLGLGASPYYLGVIGVVCLVFLLRDLGWLRFKPPQCDRQTYKEWAVNFGMVTGAGMWGAHIGLAVTTVVTYGGLYCLALVAFGAGLGSGEWILVAFWLGRVVFLWATPRLMNSSPNGMEIGMALEQSSSMFRFCSVSGIASILVLSLATLITGL